MTLLGFYRAEMFLQGGQCAESHIVRVSILTTYYACSSWQCDLISLSVLQLSIATSLFALLVCSQCRYLPHGRINVGNVIRGEPSGQATQALLALFTLSLLVTFILCLNVLHFYYFKGIFHTCSLFVFL